MYLNEEALAMKMPCYDSEGTAVPEKSNRVRLRATWQADDSSGRPNESLPATFGDFRISLSE